MGPTQPGGAQQHDMLDWRCIMENSRSQWAEDRILLPTLLAARRGAPGHFVELGALDGQSYSNTLALERCFNWTGLLIEANPTNFAILQRSGRRATMVHAAVCKDIPSITMTLQGGPAAGDVRKLSRRQLRRFNASQTVEVPCRTLTEIMATAGLASADFLSLDVEGSEDKVLETVDPAVFGTVLVEVEGKSPEVNDRVHTQLVRAALKPAASIGVQNSRVYMAAQHTHLSLSSVEAAVDTENHNGVLPPGGRPAAVALTSSSGAEWACVAAYSQSKWGEEYMLLPSLLHSTGGEPGVFVEIMDGLQHPRSGGHGHGHGGKSKEYRQKTWHSNTLALERCLGWSGLIVVSDQVSAAELRASRTSHVAVATVCSRDTDYHKGSSTSGAVAKSRPHSDAEREGAKACTSLRELIAATNLTKSHFLSASSPGATHSVLRSLDESTIRSWRHPGAGRHTVSNRRAASRSRQRPLGVGFDVMLLDWGGTKFGRSCASCLIRRALSPLLWDRRLALPHTRVFTKERTCRATPSSAAAKMCFGGATLEPSWFTATCDQLC